MVYASQRKMLRDVASAESLRDAPDRMDNLELLVLVLVRPRAAESLRYAASAGLYA